MFFKENDDGNWEVLLEELPEEKQQLYRNLKEKAMSIPRMPQKESDAIFVAPEDLDTILMRVCIDADGFIITRNSGFQTFEWLLKNLRKRVKNPVRMWFPLTFLHMIDIETNKKTKFCVFHLE